MRKNRSLKFITAALACGLAFVGMSCAPERADGKPGAELKLASTDGRAADRPTALAPENESLTLTNFHAGGERGHQVHRHSAG